MKDELKFDADGLIPAVIQDWKTGEVLMLAWMNREAAEKTFQGPFTTFWSRSRKKIWVKGEESGHTQEVKEVRLDCDNDTLLIKVEQNVAACHEGYKSCFFRRKKGTSWEIIPKKLFETEEVYRK